MSDPNQKLDFYTTFVYTLEAGSFFEELQPPLTDTIGLGWTRIYLAQNKAIDVPPSRQVLSSIGFISPRDIPGSYVEVFDRPSVLNITDSGHADGYSYNVTPRAFQVLGVRTLDAYDSALAAANAYRDGDGSTQPCVLMADLKRIQDVLIDGTDSGDVLESVGSDLGAANYFPPEQEGVPYSYVDPLDDVLPVEQSPNPIISGTLSPNPLNNPGTALGHPLGAAGTRWYVVIGVPLPQIGLPDDLAFDASTGNIYQKQQGQWTLVANFRGESTGGGGGDGTGDLHYVYTQTVASTLWSMPHGLNKYPSVSLEDQSGNEIAGDVKRPSANTVTVAFLYPVRGTAYLN